MAQLNAQKIARKYAVALFEIAKEGDISTIRQESDMVLSALKNEPNFLDTILNPRITSEQKWEIFVNAFKGASDSMMGFINIVIRKNRESELLDMLEIFNELMEQDAGVLNAEIVSATELSDVQVENIKKNLEEKTSKNVSISVVTDPLLIGGLCINVGGYVYDMSVRKQLDDMRIALLA